MATAATFAAFNMAIVWPWLWLNTTFRLEIWLLELFFGNDRSINVMDGFSRLYFVAHIAGCVGLIAVVEFLWAKFMRTPGGEWWQFRLAGMFLLTTVTCVVTALILHLVNAK